jgi:hypothetical protein
MIYKTIKKHNKMKNLKTITISLFATLLIAGCSDSVQKVQTAQENEAKALKIHEGAFAFCGASAAVPTGNKIIIQGVEFDEGCAICPVLTGPSISNLDMYGSGGTWGDFAVASNFQTPDGTDKTIWSLFWYFDTTTTIPQFNPESKKWELSSPVNRSFVINLDSPATSESNMFAMPGVVFDTTESGIVLAKVYGPLNEAAIPLRKAVAVKNGETSITAAKEGFPYPVGTPIPTMPKKK